MQCDSEFLLTIERTARRSIIRHLSQSMHTKIHQAVRLIKDACQEQMSVSRLARSVKLSRTHFSRRFKAETGLSPSQYIRSIRIKRARELLETSSLSVKEIAALVGAGDESHFLRAFKKVHGLSPTEYRRRYLAIKLVQENIRKPSLLALTAQTANK